MINVKYPRRGFVVAEVIEGCSCNTEDCTAEKLVVIPWEDYGEDNFNNMTEGVTIGEYGHSADDYTEEECEECEESVVYKKYFVVTSDANALKTAEDALNYAVDVLNAPFPEGETLIATDAYCSYAYAECILKAPFPLGEPAIATNAQYSYEYSQDVLHAIFPLGEKIIATDAHIFKMYKKLFPEPQVVKTPEPQAPATSMSDKQKEAIKYSFDNLLYSLGEWIDFDKQDCAYPACFGSESIMRNIDHLLEAFPDICKDLSVKKYSEVKSYMDEYSKKRKEKGGWGW